MKNLKEILQKRYFLILADQAISSGSNFILAILYARFLGAEEFGKYGLILFVGYLLNMIGQATIGTTMAVNIHTYQKNRIYYQTYISIKYIFIALLSIVCTYMASYFSLLENDTVLIVALFLSFFLLYDVIKKYLFSIFNIYKILFIDILYFSLVFIQLLFKYQNLNYLDVLVINLISFAISLFLVFLSFKIKTIKYNSKKIYTFFKIELEQMKHLTLSTLLQWFNSRIGFYLLAYLHSAKLVGIMNGYMAIVGIFNPLFISLDNYVLPKAAKAYKDSGIEEAKKVIDNVLNILLIPIILFSGVLILFREFIIELALGKEYLEYSFVFVLIVITYMFNFLSKRYMYIINIMKKQIVFTKIYLQIFFIIVSTSYVFIFYFSIHGAAFLVLLASLYQYIRLRDLR